MIAFDNPIVLYTLLPATLILLYLMLTNKDRIQRVFDKEVLNNISTHSGLGKKARDVVLAFAVVLMIVALARPVLITEYNKYQPQTDIAIFIDRSASMFSQDLYPSRLEYAQIKVLQLLNYAQGTHFLLGVYDKDLYLVSPFTNSYRVLQEKIEYLNIPYRNSKTDMQNLFEKSDRFFQKGGVKNILLFTDGNDLDIDAMKKYVKQNGIQLSVFQSATNEGAPMVDEDGHMIPHTWSAMNSDLKSVTQASGGIYISQNMVNSMQAVYEKLAANAQANSEGRFDPHEKLELFKALLWASIVLIFISFYSMPRFSKAVLAFMFIFQPPSGYAFDFITISDAKQAYEQKQYEKALQKFSSLRKTAQRDYNIANSYYRLQEYERAITTYKQIDTDDPKLRHKIFHNLGNSYMNLEKFTQAKESYKKALEFEKDEDTQYNLDIAKKLEEQKQQKAQKDRSEQDEKEEKGDDEQQKREQTKGASAGEDGDEKSEVVRDSNGDEKMEIEKVDHGLSQKFRRYERDLYRPDTQMIKIR